MGSVGDPKSTNRIRVGSVSLPESHVWDPYGILIGSDMRPLGSSSVPNRFLAGSTRDHSVPGRLQRVEDHLNSAALASPAGTGLLGLAKELRTRYQRVVELKGERVPE